MYFFSKNVIRNRAAIWGPKNENNKKKHLNPGPLKFALRPSGVLLVVFVWTVSTFCVSSEWGWVFHFDTVPLCFVHISEGRKEGVRHLLNETETVFGGWEVSMRWCLFLVWEFERWCWICFRIPFLRVFFKSGDVPALVMPSCESGATSPASQKLTWIKQEAQNVLRVRRTRINRVASDFCVSAFATRTPTLRLRSTCLQREVTRNARPLCADIPGRSSVANWMCEADSDLTHASFKRRICTDWVRAQDRQVDWWLNRQWPASDGGLCSDQPPLFTRHPL